MKSNQKKEVYIVLISLGKAVSSHLKTLILLEHLNEVIKYKTIKTIIEETNNDDDLVKNSPPNTVHKRNERKREELVYN